MPKTNQVKFGTKSLTNLAPKIWNSLAPNVKSADNLNSFKALIKNWDGVLLATVLSALNEFFFSLKRIYFCSTITVRLILCSV